MVFKKIPKEKWLSLSKEEKEFYTLEFNKSIEKRKRISLLATRTIAIIFIVVLVFMGFVQLKAIKNYDEIIDKYGSMGHCYLCGTQAMKKCECQYYKTYDYGNIQMELPNYTKIKEELSQYNIESCKPYDYYIKDKEQEISNLNISN